MPAAHHKRVVIVTGASRGLGRTIALAFGKAGDRVLVNYATSEQKASDVVNDILRSGGEAISYNADVRNSAEVDAMVNAGIGRWGTVDVLINNAGVTKDNLILRMREDDWDEVLDTNLKGSFHGIQSASRIMSTQQSGHIINIASIVGEQGREGQASYSAAKAGVIGLTKAAAKELGRLNVKVNAVLPGFLLTDMGETVSAGIAGRIQRENVLDRISDAEEVAAFIYHLSLMNNVSGQVFNLDSRIL
jgi:3-oxoacyl-[acyl-carrier protein] reductase